MTKKLSRQHLVEHRRKRGSDELENSEKETETAKRSIIFFAEIQRTLEKSISVSKIKTRQKNG